MQEKGYRGVAMEGRVAHWYDRRARKELDEYQALARRMAERLPAGSTVLEVAPGPGFFGIELAKLGQYKITGLDISETFVRIARENANRSGMAGTHPTGRAYSTAARPPRGVCTVSHRRRRAAARRVFRRICRASLSVPNRTDPGPAGRTFAYSCTRLRNLQAVICRAIGALASEIHGKGNAG